MQQIRRQQENTDNGSPVVQDGTITTDDVTNSVIMDDDSRN